MRRGEIDGGLEMDRGRVKSKGVWQAREGEGEKRMER